MRHDPQDAIRTLAGEGGQLAARWRFEWPAELQQAAYRLAAPAGALDDLTLVAVVGGASSGKSTVFNNLLGGRLTSRITARGHATLGPIMAVHESKRERVRTLLDEGVLLPGFSVRYAEPDDNLIGRPDMLWVTFHQVDALAGALLLDTPDFTSEAARREGDITLALLPWFDRLLVVIDHERWFDRQTQTELRGHSARFGHERMAIFNRTQEGELAEAQRLLLEHQAERLGADEALILEFRRGRGFCRFPPGTLDDAAAFVRRRMPSRAAKLWGCVGQAAGQVLNQNAERTARLAQLAESLEAAAARVRPSPWECMTALMTRAERRHLDVASRVLRIRETREWLSAQRHRVEGMIRHVPLVGSMLAAARPGAALAARGETATGDDRVALARAFFDQTARRQMHELHRAARTSRFWKEVRRWTGTEPESGAVLEAETGAPTPAFRLRVEHAAGQLDAAVRRWNEKVKAECAGVAPNVYGALGAGGLGVAVVLIAVQGPVGALTVPAAAGALWASLAKLAAVAGGGALMGKQTGRLALVVKEKLLGSEEYQAVTQAAAAVAAVLADHAGAVAESQLTQARQLVMPADHPLADALETVRRIAEDAT